VFARKFRNKSYTAPGSYEAGGAAVVAALFHPIRNIRSVWELYNRTVPRVHDLYSNPTKCVYCGEPMRSEIAQIQDGDALRGKNGEVISFAICDCCGWWSARRRFEDAERYMLSSSSMEDLSTQDTVSAASGTLVRLDENELARLSLEEVRRYLVAKGDALQSISPAHMEKIVEHAYRNAGYRTELVAKTGDGGIDVILLGKDDDLVGVQVKRYKNKVGVDEIREFMGALYVEDFVRGIFVTTSTFTEGARKYTEQLSYKRSYPIELVDSKSLLSLLRVSSVDGRIEPLGHPAMADLVMGKVPMTTILRARNTWGSFSELRIQLDGELRRTRAVGEAGDRLPIAQDDEDLGPRNEG
jgi:restriction endonuclease Mrr